MARIFASLGFVDIRVNDVPLFRQIVDGDVTIEIPVNFLIEKSGIQVLSVNLAPNPSKLKLYDDARCQVEIWKYDGGANNGEKITPIGKVCEIKLGASKEGLQSPFLSDRQSFSAQVGYQITRWSNCIKLDHKEIYPRIEEIFNKVGRLLANHRFEEYMKLIRVREENVCAALSLSPKEINIRSELLLDCLQGGFKLMPIKGKKLIKYYADNRLVTLLDHDMRSALRFINEESGEMLGIDLLLGINRGAKSFEII